MKLFHGSDAVVRGIAELVEICRTSMMLSKAAWQMTT